MLLDRENEREESRMTQVSGVKGQIQVCALERAGQCASVCHMSVNVILYKVTFYHIAKG